MSGPEESVRGDCPSRAELLSAAASDLPSSIEAHLEACEMCARAYGEIIEEATLFQDIARAVNAPDVAPANENEIVEGYTRLEKISSGGQGVVWKAIQHDTNREVALKALHAGLFASQEERARFQREIELVARLRHPGIVTVHGSITSPTGQRWVVMEYIEGTRLDDWATEKWGESPAWSAEAQNEFVVLFAQICDAAAHAQRRGIIHRDLKPSNVLVDESGSPHILDFGIARESDDQAETLTMEHEFVGTYAYAAPEQYGNDHGAIGTWTDVYAVSVMAYEALAGQRPHRWEGSLSGFIKSVCEEEPTRPSAINKGVSKDLETVVLRGLSKDPERRYQTAADLRDEFERIAIGDPIMARRDHTLYVLGRIARKYRWRVASAMLALILVLVALPLMSYFAYAAAQDAKRALALSYTTLGPLQTLDPVERRKADSDDPLNRTFDDYLSDVAAISERELADYPRERAKIESAVALAFIEQAKPRYDLALTHMRRALVLLEELHRPPHRDLATAHHNLGRIYWNTARYEEAETHYERALDMRKRLFGERDALTAETSQHLASTLTLLNNYADAEVLHRSALATQIELNGEDDPGVAQVWFSLGRCLHEQGKVEEAAECYERALEMIETQVAPTDWRIGRALDGLASVLIDQGETGRARELVARALENKELNRGREHREYASTRLLLARASIREAAGDTHHYREAERIAREVIGALEASYDDDQPETATAYVRLGESLLGRGEAKEAWAALTTALEMRQRILVEGSWPIGEAHDLLSRCAVANGDPELAREQARLALEILGSTRDEGDALRRRAEANAQELSLD